MNDSKKLTAKEGALYPVLCESALDYSIAVVDIERSMPSTFTMRVFSPCDGPSKFGSPIHMRWWT